MFESKRLALYKVELLEKKVKELEEDKKRLAEQVDSLQKALIEKVSPLAYEDLQQMKVPVFVEEETKKIEEDMRILGEYRDMCMQPLFSSPDEAIEFIQGKTNEDLDA